MKQDSKKAFTLLELMVAMGIIAILIALGMVAILSLQKRARDTDRSRSLAEISNQLTNYKRSNLEYPESSDVSFSGTKILIGEDFQVTLKGATRSSSKTDRTGTRYRYSKEDKGYALCALLESGKIENVGTSNCPSNVSNW